jgi:hypothetical protein
MRSSAVRFVADAEDRRLQQESVWEHHRVRADNRVQCGDYQLREFALSASDAGMQG